MNETKKQTQKERLLEWLETYDYCEPIVAWQELGIYRYSGVIHRLKQDGHRIIGENVKVKNRFGESISITRHRLIK